MAPPPDTAARILDAARAGLLETGYAGLSTRKIADLAGVPLSQLHYHFGGKQQVILGMLQREDDRLLARQTRMYGEERPLWERYEQACDFFDEDIESGYVRILQEMIAAGWSEPEIARAVRQVLQRWFDLLSTVAELVRERVGGLGPFTPEEVSALVGMLFMGAESMVLLGIEDEGVPLRPALRQIGALFRGLEEGDET